MLMFRGTLSAVSATRERWPGQNPSYETGVNYEGAMHLDIDIWSSFGLGKGQNVQQKQAINKTFWP